MSNNERYYERLEAGSISNGYLLQRLNDYYGGHGVRIKAIGIASVDHVQKAALISRG